MAGAAADDQDALLELAEQANDAPANPISSSSCGTVAPPEGADEDPLLCLAATVCESDTNAAAPAQQPAAPRGLGTAPARKPALCSTRAFSSATPAVNGSSAAATARTSTSTGGSTHASTAAGLPPRQSQHHEVQHFVEKLTGLKVKLPRVSGVVLKERYRGVTYVPISKAKSFSAPQGSSWVVVGVLVSKQFGTTSKGAPYSRWRVSDLGGCDANIALFGEAHKEHYAEAEGSVLAFYNPRFSAKGAGSNSSSSSDGLAVSQGVQVELLATSAGWGFCRGLTKVGGRGGGCCVGE